MAVNVDTKCTGVPDKMSHGFQTLPRSELMRGAVEPESEEQRASRSELLDNLEAAVLSLDQATMLQPLVYPQARLVSLTEHGSLGAEKFMLLSARLRRLQDQRKLKKIVLTSSVQNEGKSLVAANLAISLARGTKQKVLLLEGDLRRPALSRLFGRGELKGLSELLYGQESATRFLLRMDGLALWLLFAGILRDRPLDLLQSPRLSQLLNQFAECFDWIVIDAPPVLPLADVDLWAGLADGVLLVVRDNRTSKKTLQNALDSLKKATLLGLVLNEASALDGGYYDEMPGRTAGKNHHEKRAENGAAS